MPFLIDGADRLSCVMPSLPRPDHSAPVLHELRQRTRPRAPIAGRLLTGLLALLPALPGCAGGTASSGDGSLAIGVGAIPGSPNYEQVVHGVELAVERLNAQNPGLRFRVRLPDSTANSAVRVAQQLRDDPAVLAVVGHPESGNTLEAIPVYADAEHAGANAVVAVSPTSSSPRLSGISTWFFRVAPSDADAAGFAARWVRDSLAAQRAVVVYRNDSYGRDWASTFTAAFSADGGAVVMREPYLTDVVEWDAYAAVVAELAPDVVLFPGDGVDALAFMRAMRARTVKVAFVGGDGTGGMRVAAEAAGAHYVSFFETRQGTSPEAMHFLPRYRERHGRDPDMFAALSYDAAIVLGRTIANGARTRSSLRLALEQVGNGAPSVDGVAGRIAFEKNHDIKGRGVVMTRVSGAIPPASPDGEP